MIAVHLISNPVEDSKYRLGSSTGFGVSVPVGWEHLRSHPEW